MSPSVSKSQQRFMGAELSRKRAGLSTKTNMSESQLKDFASTARKGLPKKKPDLRSSPSQLKSYMRRKK